MSQQEKITNAPEENIGTLSETGNTSSRADETGDAAEPNAPTRVEANVGMNTILSGGFGTGIQTDASDE